MNPLHHPGFGVVYNWALSGFLFRLSVVKNTSVLFLSKSLDI